MSAPTPSRASDRRDPYWLSEEELLQSLKERYPRKKWKETLVMFNEQVPPHCERTVDGIKGKWKDMKAAEERQQVYRHDLKRGHFVSIPNFQEECPVSCACEEWVDVDPDHPVHCESDPNVLLFLSGFRVDNDPQVETDEKNHILSQVNEEYEGPHGPRHRCCDDAASHQQTSRDVFGDTDTSSPESHMVPLPTDLYASELAWNKDVITHHSEMIHTTLAIEDSSQHFEHFWPDYEQSHASGHPFKAGDRRLF
ncbi:hypothetical protein BDBG_06411 [Blastomyces gilchristii SLH14081]|uniref:Uncharacterized protein n=1 Tax=Blastomyces gilchristii (strain SLH14081) TaxID=559298 RepID=A0A179UU76_BLAGS|nr:uncharacterized protein BDBG_06411 [Blastomyces gilchristii SLH14081]OAT10591.1 hypothetical protein BDBG_06411 [Blastomyces gilchristii SLH14081]